MAFKVDHNPFSPAFCGALLRFYVICYRHGLEDACRSGDVGECQQVIDRLKQVDKFGTVENELDWNEWQFKSLQWTREDICRARVMDLIMSLRRPNHNLGFIMQLAKMYYLRGVRDWVECSAWLTADMIAAMPNYPYVLKRTHSYRSSFLRERFEFLQNECLNLIEMQERCKDTAGAYRVPPSRLRMFVERVWSSMQKRRWFDDYVVEKDAWDEVNPTKGVNLARVQDADSYTQENKGRRKKNDGKNKQQQANRRVSRKNAGGRDAAADGPVLQPTAPKRRRGRPPKNV